MAISLEHLLVILTLIGLVAGWGADHQSQKDTQIRTMERLHVLERIVVSEFPAYTAAIDWKD